MKVVKTKLPEVFHITPDVFGDDRGYFYETYRSSRYKEAGLDVLFIQDNISYSRRGVLRGLHYQHPHGQGKLVTVLSGEVFDVAVDIRKGSPTFGRWVGYYLSAENKCQLWIPEGFAHGLYVISEDALFSYKCTAYYSPQHEHAIYWNDLDIKISWPEFNVVVSEKDENAPVLADIRHDYLPAYEGNGR